MLSVIQVIIGNVNRHGLAKNKLEPPIVALKVRILPVTWYENICLRLELTGCPYGKLLIFQVRGLLMYIVYFLMRIYCLRPLEASIHLIMSFSKFRAYNLHARL